MHNVISYYALPDGFRDRMTKTIGGALNFVPIGSFRNLGFVAILKKIRALRADRLTVAIDNDNGRPLAGPLMLVAALSGGRRIDVFWPDGTMETVSRLKIGVQLGRLAVAQVDSRLAYRRAAGNLRRLNALHLSRAPTARLEKGKILYLDANLSFGIAAGGSVGHIKGVIEAFVAKGFKVDYAACKTLPSAVEGAHWWRIDSDALYGFPPEINCYTFNRRYEREIERKNSDEYSFIYQRMSVHNFTGAWLRQKKKIPLVLEYNGSEAWTAANWHVKLRLHDDAVAAERASLRAADLVVTVSKILGEEAAAAGVPGERIVVYPNCINPAIFDPGRFSAEDRAALRRKLGIAADATVATFIGTFGMWHGVEFLARAIHRLIAEDQAWVEAKKLHFLLVGDGLKMPEVRATLAGEPFERFVTLTGLVPQAEAPAYLAASDVFLSPHVPNADGSAFFGSPTKLFEYMAMERPIVASDLDQIGAVLKGTYLDDAPAPEGPLAELFTPGDEDAFLAAFRRVVDDPEAGGRMARRAREAALRSYTWEKHVGAILARMRELGMVEG